MQVHYDAEANIISLDIVAGDIAYAKEVNGVVIHFTQSHVPVLIEILEASNFLKKLATIKKSAGSAIEPAPSPTGT